MKEKNSIKVGWDTNFTMVPNEIWEMKELEQEHILTFVYLVKLGASSTGAFPSLQVLAERCKIRDRKGNISKRKARVVIEKMISIGLLEKFNRINKATGQFSSNIYYLTHPATLLNPTNSVSSEDVGFIKRTPCAIDSLKKEVTHKEIKPLNLGTPCAQDVPLENIDVDRPNEPKDSTYIDLITNTYTSKSSSVDPEEKKTCLDFLDNYNLKNKTKIVIKKKFKNLSEEKFKEIYTSLKSDPRVNSLEGALIFKLNGDWEEFETPVKTKVPKKTRGDSVTLEKIEIDRSNDQEHITECEVETTKFLTLYNSLPGNIQNEIDIKAQSLYLKETNLDSLDSLNKRIFNSVKASFITRILKERNL